MLCNSRLLVTALTALGLLHASVTSAFILDEYRADDGTAYQVLRSVGPPSGGADHDRITTLAGSTSGTGGCNLSTMTASAVNGVIPPGQLLHPFNSIKRTAILLPNDAATISFDPAGAGRVVLGTGGGALKVCRVGGDCGGTGEPLGGLGTASGGMPAACVASGVQASCEGSARETIGFGLPAAGNPPQCTTLPTVNTPICAEEPSDGFKLSPGQAIVFVFNGSISASGFGVGVGAFGIDANSSGSVCQDGGVVSASAPAQSLPGPGRPPTRHPAPTASAVGLVALAAALGLLGIQRRRRTA